MVEQIKNKKRALDVRMPNCTQRLKMINTMEASLNQSQQLTFLIGSNTPSFSSFKSEATQYTNEMDAAESKYDLFLDLHKLEM